MDIFKEWREYRDKLMLEDSQWDWRDNVPSEHLSFQGASIVAALFIIAELLEVRT